jgi:hypothetical protein
MTTKPMPERFTAGRTVPLRDRVVQALTDEGFRPTVDEEGDVVVAVQGETLFVRVLDEEPGLLSMFGQWDLTEIDADPHECLKACNSVATEMALVKLRVVENMLVVSAEHMITGDEAVQTLLGASIGLIQMGAQGWVELMRGVAGTTAPAG